MKTLLNALAPYRKAVVSGLIAALFAAIPLVADGHVSAAEVSLIVGAFVSGAGLVYKVSNAPAKTDS